MYKHEQTVLIRSMPSLLWIGKSPFYLGTCNCAIVHEVAQTYAGYVIHIYADWQYICADYSVRLRNGFQHIVNTFARMNDNTIAQLPSRYYGD